MSSNAPAASTKSSHSSSLMHSPPVVFIGGLLLLSAFVFCSQIQIQTSEAYLLGKQPLDVGFSWSIVQQFKDLITGKITGVEGIVDAACFVVEILTIIIGCCLEITAHGVRRSSELLANAFVWLSFALLLWNGFTDYQYASLPTGFCGQSFVALAISLAVVFGLPGGIECITRAVAHFKR